MAFSWARLSTSGRMAPTPRSSPARRAPNRVRPGSAQALLARACTCSGGLSPRAKLRWRSRRARTSSAFGSATAMIRSTPHHYRVNREPARRVLRLVNKTGYPGGPPCPEGRLLALRCLGLPLVATTPMSRRRALRYRLAACCARLRPGTTAELASLVLRMSDEIDTRERMLDAALGSA